jgi:multidrug efflux pump
MNISEPFIRRPVATSLLTAAVLLFGVLGFRLLPVSSLPEVTYPVIQVSANLPGASPENMASAVATPLERMFGRIAGINQMTSVSQLGGTNIVMQFDLDRDIDGAARDVEAAINAARGQLPATLPNNPSWRKANPAEAPIMVLALTSVTATRPQIYDVADSILAQKIAQIAGVGQVTVGGSSQPAVRVELNPLQLSNLGVSMEQVRTALGRANANIPVGARGSAPPRVILQDNQKHIVAKE